MLEQELKLKVLTEARLSLAQHPVIVEYDQGGGDSKKLVSTYYDTKDRLLMRNGLGLRMRYDGSQRYQTVKTVGISDKGLHQRNEWECALTKSEWDIDQLRKTPLKSILDNANLWPCLQPIFETNFLRETYLLSTDESNLIELAYDYGKVNSSDLSVPIHEIELELKKGSLEVLLQLGEMFVKSLPVVASDLNKSEVGYRLIASS